MANPSKARGTAWESAIVKHAKANGFPWADRQALSGSLDRGDGFLCPGIIFEAKDWADYCDSDVTKWWEETKKEKANANASVALLIVKRAYRPTGMAWCWIQGEWSYWQAMRLDDALNMLRDQGWGDPRD